MTNILGILLVFLYQAVSHRFFICFFFTQTFSPDNEDLNSTSNRAFVKMEGDKSERDNQSLEGSKSDASDKDSVRFSPGEGFI